MNLREHFKLDPNSPSYVAWARDGKRRGKFRAGDPVVGESGRGYYAATPEGQLCLMHRVVYELTHGHCPQFIDHIDGNKRNNHPDNLRAATKAANQWNHSRRADNTTGVKGLSYSHSQGLWRGQVIKNGKAYRKSSKDRAVVEAWLIATRAELHKEYANHG